MKHPVIREPSPNPGLASAPAKLALPKIRGGLEPQTEVKIVDASKVAVRKPKKTEANPEQ